MIFDMIRHNDGSSGYGTSTAVMDFTDSIATEAVDFLTAVICGYWGIILSVSFVLFMIGIFWRMAKLKRR